MSIELPPASAHRLCAWLNSLDGTWHDARPLWLRIGNTIYPSGAQYTDSVGETVIYLLGRLPASYASGKHSLYAITGIEADDMLWYVSGYFPGRPGDLADERYKQYHPFGRMLMLRRSNVPVKRREYEDGINAYSWLTHGNRGGRRPVMHIKRIWLDPHQGCDTCGWTTSSATPHRAECAGELRTLEVQS